MYLTSSHINQYHQDGYLLVPNLFTKAEVHAMLAAVESGGRVAGATKGTADAKGKAAKLAIWFDLKNGDGAADIWTAVSTHPRIVNNIRMLMGAEIAFFHGKVMLKEPHSGGAWEWHQDYGYWYNQGYAYPHLMSAFVALDPATKENGCLQVLRGSHHLGRLDHTEVGTQTGAEEERMKRIEEMLERVHCEMTPGSVLFFHSNLLHGSAPNESDHSRRAFIICYNALSNPQFAEKQTSDSVPCPVAADDILDRYMT